MHTDIGILNQLSETKAQYQQLVERKRSEQQRWKKIRDKFTAKLSQLQEEKVGVGLDVAVLRCLGTNHHTSII